MIDNFFFFENFLRVLLLQRLMDFFFERFFFRDFLSRLQRLKFFYLFQGRSEDRISVVDFFIEENIVNEKSIEGLFSFNERGEFIRLINYISINDVSLLTLDVEVVPTFNALS